MLQIKNIIRTKMFHINLIKALGEFNHNVTLYKSKDNM